MPYTTTTVPAGEKITVSAGGLNVPDIPIIPFIRGDGTGPDIWRAAQAVFDAAVQKAYGGRRRIAWMEVYAGEEAFGVSTRGCRKTRWRRSASSGWGSRGRSPLLSAGASVR